MDQYFDRMDQLSRSPSIPSRMRFMLQDTIELREARWVPRRAAQTDGPRTIQEVREEAWRDLGVPTGGLRGHCMPDVPFFNARTGMEDVFGAPPLGAVSLGTGPGVISTQDDYNGYYRPKPTGTNNFYPNKHFNNAQNQYNNNFNRQNGQNNAPNNFSNAANKELPTRFMKLLTNGGPDEVSLRPITSMLTAPKPRLEQEAPAMVRKEPPVVIKTAEKAKNNKKDKGPTKEKLLGDVANIMLAFYEGGSVEDAVAQFKDLKVPEKFVFPVFLSILKVLVNKEEPLIEKGIKLINQLKAESVFTAEKLTDTVKQWLDDVDNLTEKEEGRMKLAVILSSFVDSSILNLSDCFEPFENSQNSTVFIEVLKRLNVKHGEMKLKAMFNECKVSSAYDFQENILVSSQLL